MFNIGVDIEYSNLKLAFGKVSDDGLAKPAVTRVLPAGAGRMSDIPLRIGKADGDTDALVVNVNSETWTVGVDLDATPGAASRDPDDLTVAGDRLSFAADDGSHGCELWVSNGRLQNRTGKCLEDWRAADSQRPREVPARARVR